MEGLNIDNILEVKDIDTLFGDDVEDSSPQEENEETNEEENNETTEVDVDSLFEQPESVGSGTEDKGKEDTESDEESVTSQSKNFYSSIANALKDDGIFPDLDDEILSKVKDPDSFVEAMEKQIQSRFDERQRRIEEALNAGVDNSAIRQFENTMTYLDSIQKNYINDESDAGEKLRKQLIAQDFINRGYSKERAEKEVKKSFDAGTDIEDAMEALQSNKEFFKGKYNEVVRQAQAEEQAEVEERKKQAAELKKSILEDKKVFGDVEIDKATRQKVFDSISKPVYKDPETGEFFTEIQKYEMEHRTDFLKNLGLLYTLTDGFKNIDKLVKGRVNKEVKKGIKRLEDTINSSSRLSGGSLTFATGSDPESMISKEWKLDLS